ncbi:MAG: bifunctional DNA-formamidopyrimidine glycosylase/DNA-(apurinic or apyrimidinic site) lyase [Gemmataceae bacterium]|nr:bifunctional DNA-formamidopyrimidine glycosylase/DNA-(apurinic or apyrimidinic site) lyase [Gemmataceae bacterium]
MPELPEVETVVRDLRPLLVGRRLTRLEKSALAMRRNWDDRWKKRLVSRTVRAVERRGKWILLDLEGPWMLVHLGMTGQFTVASSKAPRENHTHFIFRLDDGDAELRFRDIRRFGSLTVFDDRPTLDSFFIASKLGPEPFGVDAKYWLDALRSTRRNLKATLLDQTIVAGVGNIYADESLHLAKLHPGRLANSLTAAEAERLRLAVENVLTQAIAHRGSTIRDYVGGSGLMGGFQDEFGVYGRTGEPCRGCRSEITRIVLAGRSTHFCARCQKQRG